MDPTLAALIGAGLGAAATAVVPVLSSRARRREAIAERQRQEAGALLEVCIRLLHARMRGDGELFTVAHAEGVLAIERLLLTASRRDVDELQQVTAFAFEAISEQENTALASVGVEAMAQVLRRWCRGELRGSAIGNAYAPAIEVQADRRERKWKR